MTKEYLKSFFEKLKNNKLKVWNIYYREQWKQGKH